MAKSNQPCPRLMISHLQKMTGLQLIAVVDEVPVAIEEVGGVDTVENEGIEEIVVVGAVSDLSERSLIQRLTYDPDLAHRGRGDGEFRGRGDGKERNLCISLLILILGWCSPGYRSRGDGEWRSRGDGEGVSEHVVQVVERSDVVVSGSRGREGHEGHRGRGRGRGT